MVPVALRAGMVYGRGVLMIEAARWLARHRLLAVWRKPTWNHLISLPDFLSAIRAAIEGTIVSGIYQVADEEPLTLQQIGDRFRLTRERARQIEAKLVKRLRDQLRDELPDFEFMVPPE